MTYREAINLGEKVLNMADVADAKIDAWLLLEMVCKIDRSCLCGSRFGGSLPESGLLKRSV